MHPLGDERSRPAGGFSSETIRPVPASLAGTFGDVGLNLHTGGLIVVLSLMLVSYAVVATAADERSQP